MQNTPSAISAVNIYLCIYSNNINQILMWHGSLLCLYRVDSCLKFKPCENKCYQKYCTRWLSSRIIAKSLLK